MELVLSIWSLKEKEVEKEVKAPPQPEKPVQIY